mmetsp:Transcript_56086/g.64351  ORF Transcript_56086/g.64351 Transcript_56086/m.64351 type:complete len:107 (-) Transcript_56086:85-405(-)
MGNSCCSESRDKKDSKDSEKVKAIKREAAQRYQAADLDGNQIISFDEFFKLAGDLSKQLKVPAPTQDQVKKIFDECDSNKDHKLSFDEYLDATVKLQESLQKESSS